MAGLSVTAVFSDGFSRTLVWAGTGGSARGVSQTSGTSVVAFGCGSYPATTFELTNSASSTSNITDIILSGIGGVNGSGQATIFDRTSIGNTGTSNEQTPGSRSGQDLSISRGTLNTYDVLVK